MEINESKAAVNKPCRNGQKFGTLPENYSEIQGIFPAEISTSLQVGTPKNCRRLFPATVTFSLALATKAWQHGATGTVACVSSVCVQRYVTWPPACM